MPARQAKAALEPEGTRRRALRMALLALAIAEAGSEGIARESLEALPEVRSLYSDGAPARYAALRRDLETLSGEPLRGVETASGEVESPAAAAPVIFDRTSGRYRLRRPGINSLKLSTEALEALYAVARALRGGAALPGGRELFVRLAEVLDDEQRDALDAAMQGDAAVQRPGIALDLGLRESIGGLDRVMSFLWRAWRERRTVKFSYRAKDKVTEHYNDEVLEIWVGEHAYACMWSEEANASFELRLDRIIPETLSFAPKTARGRSHRGIPIRYRLAATVARGEVTQRLDGQTVEWQDDGTAIVSGRARSLFWAKQLLLKYGAQAKALEPSTLVETLRRESQRLCSVYAAGIDGPMGEEHD